MDSNDGFCEFCAAGGWPRFDRGEFELGAPCSTLPNLREGERGVLELGLSF